MKIHSDHTNIMTMDRNMVRVATNFAQALEALTKTQTEATKFQEIELIVETLHVTLANVGVQVTSKAHIQKLVTKHTRLTGMYSDILAELEKLTKTQAEWTLEDKFIPKH